MACKLQNILTKLGQTSQQKGLAQAKTFGHRMVNYVPKQQLVNARCVRTDTLGDVNMSSQRPAPKTMEFGDFKHAFRPKRTGDLIRALWILKLSSFDIIVDNSIEIINYGRKLCGKTVFDSILKRTMYKQFVGGNSLEEMKECVGKLHDVGIQAMLAVPIEEDIDTVNKSMSVYDKNLEILVNCINIENILQPKVPMTQIRVTAITSITFLAKVSKLCPSPTQSPSIIYEIVNAMNSGNKVTMDGLTEVENTELNEAISRLVTIGEAAKKNNVIIMVDAEYTCINPAMKMFVLSMMLHYNQDKPLICFTYQCYLKTTLQVLKEDLEFILSRNRSFGLKLVRGAYMYREREMAKKEGYPNPIHDTAYDTSKMYNEAVSFIIDQVAQDAKCAIMVASHNEESVNHTVKKLQELDIKPDCGKIFFGQLYGMCDHVSFTLGQAGFPIYKSIPYGEIDHTLPYLIRRAQENRSIIPGARREKELLKRALWDRFVL